MTVEIHRETLGVAAGLVATVAALVGIFSKIPLFAQWYDERRTKGFARRMGRAIRHPTYGPECVRLPLDHLFSSEIMGAARREERLNDHDREILEVRQAVDALQTTMSKSISDALERIARSSEATTHAMRDLRAESIAGIRELKEEQKARDKAHADRMEELGDHLNRVSGMLDVIRTATYSGPERRRHPREE